jgi:hypothetical protein
MVSSGFPRGLVIRSAFPVSESRGIIIAVDPTKADRGVPHAIILGWTPVGIDRRDLDFDVMQGCVFGGQVPGLVLLAWSGEYQIEKGGVVVRGTIYDAEPEEGDDSRYGSFTAIAQGGGSVFAVGLRGTCFELIEIERWVPRDSDLPESFNPQAICIRDDRSVLVAGRRGEIWRFDRGRWVRAASPTNVNLSCVSGSSDGKQVFAGGRRGTVVSGSFDSLCVIEYEGLTDDIWGIASFRGDLFVSTLTGVYRLAGNRFDAVEFGVDPPSTTNTLTACNEALWSVGSDAIMGFDGAKWFRVV